MLRPHDCYGVVWTFVHLIETAPGPVPQMEDSGPEELLALPRGLDRPLHCDRAATGLAFGGLVSGLEADFGAPCESERPNG